MEVSRREMIRAELAYLFNRQWAPYMAFGAAVVIGIGTLLHLQYGNEWPWVVLLAIFGAYWLGYAQRRDIQMRLIRQHLANIRCKQHSSRVNFAYLYELLKTLNRLAGDVSKICADDCFCPYCNARHIDLSTRPMDPDLHESSCPLGTSYLLLSGQWRQNQAIERDRADHNGEKS